MIDLLVRDELIAAPRSSLNVSIGATRRIAAAHVELEELRAIRSALGGTGQRCRAVCGHRCAALLPSAGEDPPRQGLRAMVPVNVRSEGNHDDLGNQVSSLFVGLPAAEADPLRRYLLVVAATVKLKAGGQALAASALTGLTELVPPVLYAGDARMRFAKRLFNVTITNVPALAGARVCVRRGDGRHGADRSARGRARTRDRGRLLRRRNDVWVMRRARNRSRTRCPQRRHRHLLGRASRAGAPRVRGPVARPHESCPCAPGAALA